MLHPAGDISDHLRFLQARENPRIVYDQAGVLLLKVIACLSNREHVGKKVCMQMER